MKASKEIISAAQDMGKLAYENGKTRVPAHDANLMKLIQDNSTGMGWSIPVMKAWYKGWDKANLSN